MINSFFVFFFAHFRPLGVFSHAFWSVLGPLSAPGRFFSLLGRPFLSLPNKVPKKGAPAHRRTESPHPFWVILVSILVPFLVAFSGLKIGLFLDPPGRDFGPKRGPFWAPFWCYNDQKWESETDRFQEGGLARKKGLAGGPSLLKGVKTVGVLCVFGGRPFRAEARWGAET